MMQLGGKSVCMFLLGLFVFLCPSWAQESDTLCIRFKLDSTQVNLNFDGNRERLETFLEAFNARYAGRNPRAIQLDIYAGASPEGPANHNRWLGENRGRSIARLLRDRLGKQVGTVNINNLEARWDDFYDAVAVSNEPWRDQVLAIVRRPASADGFALDDRELALRRLQHGEVWPVLLEKYLAPLRSGATAVVSWHPERDTIVIRETVTTRDTVVVVHENTYVAPVVVAPERQPSEPYPAWALKTNVPLLGVLAPNIEAEFPIGTKNRWSVEGEVIFPWWTFARNAYAEQVLNLGVEFKYWLGKREYHPWLDGWHIGLGAAAGYYDLEWKSKGYQGEYVNAYFNVGYQHRWGRRKRWGVDAGLGIGVIYTPRHRYYIGSTLFPETHTEPYDDHLMYQNKGTMFLPGVTHVNISLMYFFDLKRREK